MRTGVILLMLTLAIGCSDKASNSNNAPFQGTYSGSILVGCPACSESTSDAFPRSIQFNFSGSRYSYAITTQGVQTESGTGTFSISYDLVTFVGRPSRTMQVEISSIVGTFGFDYADNILSLHRNLTGEFYQDVILERAE